MGVPAYDTLESVANATRQRILDAIVSTAGNAFTDTAPSTILAINNGWRRMQEFLAKLGFKRFTNHVTLTGLAVVSSGDPDIQTTLTAAGYFNGATTQALLALPRDFISPIFLRERISGIGATYLDMDNLSDSGIPLGPKEAWNKFYSWRNETVYMPGALSVIDLHLQYWGFAADFVPASTTAFASQVVPIMRCQDCLSNYIAAEWCRARGDIDGKQFTTDAESEAMILVGRENPAVYAANIPPPAPIPLPNPGGPQ